MNDCVFCKIVRGEIPCYKVYEDSNCLAFLDINPASRGHVLVVPKKHFKSFIYMSEKEYIEFMKSFQHIGKGMAKYSEDFNVVQNNGKEAGQVVEHLHFHIIPRRAGDGLHLGAWRSQQDHDIEKVQTVIKSLLKD
jgi:histidine triad (HIT) family protein